MRGAIEQIHLERVVVVVEQRSRQDGSFASWDLGNTEGPLRCSGLVGNIDILYYSDYTPNADEAVRNYCLQKKPQAVLLSLQSMLVRGGGLTPDGVERINKLGIPTVMFWWSIYADTIVDLMETYSPTLNVIVGADPSSHKPIKCRNHVYAPVAFDDNLFNMPDGVRDIPVGLLGSLVPFRRQWVEGLKEFGIPVYTGGGQLVDGGDTSFSTGKVPPLWVSYEEYLGLTSRMKIVLNFSSGTKPMYLPVTSSVGQIERGQSRLTAQLRGGFSALVKNPSRLRYAMPALKNIASISVKKPREMTRMRVFEALWCRTFLLEEDNSITSVYFEPYVDYVPFSTLSDLVDKIRYYLENGNERDRIRLQGRATVEKYYNARIYWENIFEAIGIPSDKQYHHHPGEVWNKAHFDNWYLSASTR